MKKIKTVTTPAVPAQKKKVEVTVCDFCTTTVPDHGSYGWFPKCSICDRDTCRKHNKVDPHNYDDYPDWYCEICYNLRYGKYQDEYLDMIDKHEREEQEFMEKLKKESLKTPCVSIEIDI